MRYDDSDANSVADGFPDPDRHPEVGAAPQPGIDQEPPVGSEGDAEIGAKDDPVGDGEWAVAPPPNPSNPLPITPGE